MNKGKRWMKFMGVGLAGVVLLGLGVACGSSTTTDDDTTSGNGSGALETVETQISVGPNLADCVGLGPRTCMVVDGSLFYDYIEGFNHIEGCSYQLDIARDQVYTAENAPSDGRCTATGCWISCRSSVNRSRLNR